MAHKKTSNDSHKPSLDLRFKVSHEPLDANAKRFDVFLIDSGWNVAVGKLVRSHLPTLLNFEKEDDFYILSPEQSVQLLKQTPNLIGHDPIILVYDLYAPP